MHHAKRVAASIAATSQTQTLAVIAIMTDEKEEEFRKLIQADKVDKQLLATLNEQDRKDLIGLVTNFYLLSQSAKFRGKVIDIAVVLEAVLVELLGRYFVPENQKKNTMLKSIILDRQTFPSKLNWLTKILKLSHREIYEKHEKDLKEIGRIIDFRNNIAHSILDTGPEFSDEVRKTPLPERVRVMYYKGDRMEFEVITKEDADKFYADCYRLIGVLQSISKELGIEE